MDGDGWEEYIRGFLNTTFLEEDRVREEEEEREMQQRLLEEEGGEEENNEDYSEDEGDYNDEMGISMVDVDNTVDPNLVQMFLEIMRRQRHEDENRENEGGEEEGNEENEENENRENDDELLRDL